MDIIKTLTELYSTETGKITMLLLFWAIWPGLTFVVGVIFESRLVPIWRLQSKAFIPGNFALGFSLMKLVEIYIATIPLHTWGKRPLWWTAAGLIALLLAVRFYFAEIEYYPPRARLSPTKIFHDLVGYSLLTFLLVGILIPQGWLILTSEEITEEVTNGWSLAVFGFVGYFMCVVYDASALPTDLEIAARYPADWRPLWKKRK